MLKVGASKVCINPTDDMFPIPTSRRDWGATAKPQECVYDDMNVRAIAIENGSDKLMFVVYELSGPPAIEELPQLIADAVGYDKDNIILSATHNHTGVKDNPMGPMNAVTPEELEFFEKYKKIETERGIEAAKKAVAALRPARYGYGESESYINVNRDLKTMFGFWVEARNLAGYSDKTLAIIKFVDEDGKLIAALMNHGTHATNCYMAADSDGKMKTSGNFTGITCRFVEEHYGDGAVAVWTSGAAGNQNPVLSHGMQYEYPDGYTSAVNYPDGVPYMQMEFMGRYHGADCVRGIEAISDYREDMPIKHFRRSAYLPRQKKVFKEGQIFPFRMGGNGIRQGNDAPQYPDIPDRIPVPENPVELRMQLILLGDIAIVGAGAELYAELGRDIKALSPYKKTFVLTHTENKLHAAGYILDKSSADHVVFQAFSDVIPGSADDLILDCEKQLFEDALKG